MRILRVVSELDFGGVEQVIANSIPRLAQLENNNILIAVLGKGGEISQKLTNQGIQIEVFNKNSRIPNFPLLLKLNRLCKAFKPDVVHCQGGEANFHGILGASFAKVPRIIGEEIGLPNHHSYWKYIFRGVYKKAHQLIAISEAVKKEIVDLKEVHPDKVRVLFNPVSLEFFQTHLVKKETDIPFVFICTCRLVRIKNLDNLLKVFALLLAENNRKIELWIVGDGPLKQELQELVQKLEIKSHVKFLGFQQDIKVILKQADVFVLPSLQEGSSVSLAEAMAVGLPSIVTNKGGAVELLGDSNSGILIEPLHIDSIKIAMQQLLEISNADRISMGESAKGQANRFHPEQYIKSLMEIYQH